MSAPLKIGDYTCLERLGAGGQATTWLVEAPGADEPLLMKVYHLDAAHDWKSFELFERAARVLERLDHPNIPAYRDHFELEEDSLIKLCLVREFVPGDSLQERIDQGGSYDEAEVIELAITLLDALDHLHKNTPPIVHRDLKPANIILDPRSGQPVLVDFGAVQAEVISATGGSTVVGTAGYVAPEQLMGFAEPSSDIYALGVTLVHLLTGTPPTDLAADGFALDYRDQLRASAGLTYVLGRMTQPDVAERENSAAELRASFEALRAGLPVAVLTSTLPLAPPAGKNRLVVDQRPETLVIEPHKRLIHSSQQALLLLPIGFLVALLVQPLLSGILSALSATEVVALSCITLLPFLLFLILKVQARGLSLELATDDLRITQPLSVHDINWKIDSLRGHPTLSETKSDSYIDIMRAANRDAGDGETWAHFPKVIFPYDAIDTVSIVRRRVPRGRTSVDLWLLRIETCAPAYCTSASDEEPDQGATIEGLLLYDLGLTHGEYLWLCDLLQARVSQHRELSDARRLRRD